MPTLTLTAFSDDEMMKIGENLIPFCKPPFVVFLQGDLGAGKTTLVRGFLRGLGYGGAVKSPTYTLVENYTLDDKKIYHFDLYRLRDPEELDFIGIRDYFNQDSICFIEWPEQGHSYIAKPNMICEIDFLEGGRKIKINWSE